MPKNGLIDKTCHAKDKSSDSTDNSTAGTERKKYTPLHGVSGYQTGQGDPVFSDKQGSCCQKNQTYASGNKI